MTCGGARSGKYATGNNGMEMAPPKMMKREQTVANTGRWMKKSTNKAGFRPRWSWSVAAHLVGRDYLPVELLTSFCICSLTGIPSCRNCVPETMMWSPGFKPSSTAKSFPTVSPSFTTRWRATARSEEHTSELQSHSDLVCRLLLEKKKEYNTIHT